MKIAVLGAGALGSILSAHLLQAGHDVQVIARGARAAYLKEHGFTITGLAEFNVPCPGVTGPKLVTEADVLIITVKTYDMEAALADVAHVNVGSVFSIQNGVMKDEQISEVFGTERTLGAAAVTSGELLPDGTVQFTLNEGVHIGELSGEVTQRVHDIVDALEGSGVGAKASGDVVGTEWSKFVPWVAGMAMSVLTRLETYKWLSDPDNAHVMVGMMREVAAIPEKMGISLEDIPPIPVKALCALPFDQALEQLQAMGRHFESVAPTHKISTLQDLERGRRLEVEETLGYAVRKAKELGIEMPMMDTCYRLMAGINKFAGA